MVKTNVEITAKTYGNKEISFRSKNGFIDLSTHNDLKSVEILGDIGSVSDIKLPKNIESLMIRAWAFSDTGSFDFSGFDRLKYIDLSFSNGVTVSKWPAGLHSLKMFETAVAGAKIDLSGCKLLSSINLISARELGTIKFPPNFRNKLVDVICYAHFQTGAVLDFSACKITDAVTFSDGYPDQYCHNVEKVILPVDISPEIFKVATDVFSAEVIIANGDKVLAGELANRKYGKIRNDN